MYISDLFTVVAYLHTAGFKNRRGTFVPSVLIRRAWVTFHYSYLVKQLALSVPLFY